MTLICPIILIFLAYSIHSNWVEALNCKPFTPADAKFVVKNFHKIPLGDGIVVNVDEGTADQQSPTDQDSLIRKQSAAKIVKNFMIDLREKLAENGDKSVEEQTVLNNGRKIVTIATDICHILPENAIFGSGYIHCVEYLFNEYMQKLVWRLEHKWGISGESQTDLLQQNRDNDEGTSDQSPPPMDLIWEIEAENDRNRSDQEQRLTLMDIYTGKKAIAWHKMAEIYGKYVEELSAERIRRKLGFCLEIRGETQLKCDPISEEHAFLFAKYFHKIPIPNSDVKMSDRMATNLFNALKLERAKDESIRDEGLRRWKQAEPSMRIRVQILVNTAQQQCKKLQKNPFRIMKKIAKNFEKTNNAERPPELNDDEMDSDFMKCIYHYFYAYTENLLQKIGAENAENIENLRKTYGELRKMRWEQMKMVYTEKGLEEMESWFGVIEDRDPFKGCANIVEYYNRVPEEIFIKSFDEHLLTCTGKFLEAVVKDQFSYSIFVNLNNEQLDIGMPFPEQMQQNVRQSAANDECLMMRELLISLNKNIVHRLNVELITPREEKEKFAEMQQKMEDLWLERQDANIVNRLSAKNEKMMEYFGREVRKWLISSPFLHPIRDEYRKLMEGGGSRGKVEKAEKQRKAKGVEIKERNPEKKSHRRKRSPSPETGRKGSLRQLLESNREAEAEEKRVAQIDAKIAKLSSEIANFSLTKRLELYKKFFKAYYIALAIEMYERMQNRANWQFEIGNSENDNKYYLEIKNRQILEIFDEIVKRMGNKLKKASLFSRMWKEKHTHQSRVVEEEEESRAETGEGAEDEDEENNGPIEVKQFELTEGQRAEDKAMGVGHELRHLGYVGERDGTELLQSLREEMSLNLDQFNLSWDSDCDLSNDLAECFVTDGLNLDEYLAKTSLFGKERDQMGMFEKVAESLFKRLSRWSYKFWRRGKNHRNVLARFFNRHLQGMLGTMSQMMTGQVSPFELVIPFFLPIKKGVKFVVKKVVVRPGQRLFAWVLKLFGTASALIRGKEDEMERQMGGEEKVETVEMSEIEPQMVSTADGENDANINSILKQFPRQTDKKNGKKSWKIFGKLAEALKEFGKKFVTKRIKEGRTKGDKNSESESNEAEEGAREMAESSEMGEIRGNGLAMAELKQRMQRTQDNAKQNDEQHHKRERRGIESGAAMNAYIPAEQAGSSTIEAIIIDGKIAETGLTTPIPSLHLHWLHIHHAVMIGKYNIALSFASAVLLVFIVLSVIYWWDALKLAVWVAMLYGDEAGWAVLAMAAILFVLACFAFF